MTRGLTGGGVAALALLLLGCAPGSSPPPDAAGDAGQQAASPLAGPATSVAPDWQASSLDGESISLADLRGEVVVLNIWATWCAPCLREMPKLQQLADDYAAAGVRVIGVSIDRGSALRQVRSFVDELAIGFPILTDPDQSVMTAFAALGVPETFLIDRDGRVAHRWTGEFDPGAADERAHIDAVL